MVTVHREDRKAEVPLGGSRQTLDMRVVRRACEELGLDLDAIARTERSCLGGSVEVPQRIAGRRHVVLLPRSVERRSVDCRQSGGCSHVDRSSITPVKAVRHIPREGLECCY